MKPLVSLISPVYNSMPYLKTFIQCVIDQTWRPLELILADDGSTDGSVDYILSMKQELESHGISLKLLLLSHKNQASAVNSALKETTGEFLTWCDSDDYMLTTCIEKKVAYLIDHPEIGIVRNDGIIIHGDLGKEITRDSRECDRKTQWIFHDLFWQHTYCYAGCYMIRMTLFLECYPDKEIPISPEGQNLQMLLPAASRSQCGFVPEVLHLYFKRETGHSSKKRSYVQFRERILNFSSLLREILPVCICDHEQYEIEIQKIEKSQLDVINYSVLFRAREAMKKNESGNTDIR